MDAAEPPSRPGRTAPLFGRSEIHDALLQTLDEARAGSGQFLLLVGEAGVGKSTLLARTVEDARDLGFLTVTARALPSDLPSPLALVQDLLRNLPPTEEQRPGSAGPDLGYLSLFLAPYETDRPTEGAPSDREREADHLLRYLAGPPARVEESRVLIFDRLTDLFRKLAEHEPMLLAIDDLQFADDSSIEFLERFARELGDARAAVVATIVPSTESPARTSHLVGRLLSGERAARLTVRKMTEPELSEYARWLLNGRDPGREAVLRWYT
ncbi:MAG: BREX system ATP-binding domain-containing protein, partial [Thermoplasmata archaeon]